MSIETLSQSRTWLDSMPARRDVVEVVPRQVALVGAVGVHHEALCVAPRLAREEDLRAVRRPGRGACFVAVGGREDSGAAAVDADDGDLRRALRREAREEDRPPVGRPARGLLEVSRAGEPAAPASVGLDDEEVAVTPTRRSVENELLAVW